ncbi:MAG: hypothetical protein JNL74_01990 [Fibrobacteres bacterium]|nr:hypothetical protein [Fibrobacterota bacterium]
MKIIVYTLILSLVTFLHAEKYMIIHSNQTKTTINLNKMDSLTFVETTITLRGSILATNPFYTRIEEFNTLGLSSGSSKDNNFGACNSGDVNPAHASAVLSFADVCTDYAVISSTLLSNLFDSSGQSLKIQIGDTLFLSATINGGISDETITAFFVVISNPLMSGRTSSILGYRCATIQQLLLCAEEFITGSIWRGGAGSSCSDVHIAISPDGRIIMSNGIGSTSHLMNINFSSSNVDSKSIVSSAFFFPSLIAVNSLKYSKPLLRPSKATDHLYNPLIYDNAGNAIDQDSIKPCIYLSNGSPIDLKSGDSISVSGSVGNVICKSLSLILSSGTYLNSSTSFQDILDLIRNTLQLPLTDNTEANKSSVSVAGSTDSPVFKAGSLIIRGQPDTSKLLTNVKIIGRAAFNQNTALTEF